MSWGNHPDLHGEQPVLPRDLISRDVSQIRNSGYDRCHGFHRIVDFGDKMLLRRNKTGPSFPEKEGIPGLWLLRALQFQGLKRVVTLGAGGGDSASGSSARWVSMVLAGASKACSSGLAGSGSGSVSWVAASLAAASSLN